jgi:phosphoribosylaminoimidazolecarboxamide formyltransferase/IMP cyclohydrolase
VIVAPAVSEAACEALAAKANVRVLVTGEFSTAPRARHYQRVSGGLLVQDRDDALVGTGELRVASRREPTPEEMRDLLFAWNVAKYVKSNAIVYARDLQTVGVGAGQMSRVNSARIAAIKAEHAGLEVRGPSWHPMPSSRSATASIMPLRRASRRSSSPAGRCATRR